MCWCWRSVSCCVFVVAVCEFCVFCGGGVCQLLCVLWWRCECQVLCVLWWRCECQLCVLWWRCECELLCVLWWRCECELLCVLWWRCECQLLCVLWWRCVSVAGRMSIIPLLFFHRTWPEWKLVFRPLNTPLVSRNTSPHNIEHSAGE